MFARLVRKRAASEHGEPAPKDWFARKSANVPDDTRECGLQRFARGVLIAGSDDNEITPESIEIGVIKKAIRGFVAGGHAASQGGCIQRFRFGAARRRPAIVQWRVSIQVGSSSANASFVGFSLTLSLFHESLSLFHESPQNWIHRCCRF